VSCDNGTAVQYDVRYACHSTLLGDNGIAVQSAVHQEILSLLKPQYLGSTSTQHQSSSVSRIVTKACGFARLA